MFENNRGITPLVATVLLVAFSVGLGALVMSWGEDYIAQKAEFVQGTGEVKSDCDTAHIDFIRIAGQPQACLGARGLELWIDNGEVDVSNIHARIAGSNGVDVIPDILLAPLVKANSARAIVAVKPEVGQLLQVKLTPKVWTGSKESTCANSAITLEQFPQCSG
ncbi:MAG TPA: hypothetical protein VJJ82_04335 [Candidatus Nanoarchaeia archaeon]|nr:hypothetical protein [Candidatus Nanoarchaeia archaeon]